MFWLIKISLVYPLIMLITTWLLYKAHFLVVNYLEFRRLRSQGVVFMGDNTFAIFRDIPNLIKTLNQYPHCFNQTQFFKNSLGVT